MTWPDKPLEAPWALELRSKQDPSHYIFLGLQRGAFLQMEIQLSSTRVGVHEEMANNEKANQRLTELYQQQISDSFNKGISPVSAR